MPDLSHIYRVSNIIYLANYEEKKQNPKKSPSIHKLLDRSEI